MNFFQRLFRTAAGRIEAPDSIKTGANKPMIQNMSGNDAVQLISQGEVFVLDVRSEREYQHHRIPGAALIPLPQLTERYKELNPARSIVVVCEHGMRSAQACRVLSGAGFKNLYNLSGGMASYPGPQEGTAK
jgi:rhodanese-related sulfurtransferase